MEEIVRKNTQQLLACAEKGIFCSKSQQKSTTISKLGVTLFPSAKAQRGLSLYLSVWNSPPRENIYSNLPRNQTEISHLLLADFCAKTRALQNENYFTLGNILLYTSKSIKYVRNEASTEKQRIFQKRTALQFIR